MAEYALPALDYPTNALEPHISGQIMELHHGKHHKAYVDGANNALKKLAEARAAGDFSLVKHWSRELSFHGSGHVNHCVFWKNLAPAGNGGGGQPAGDLAATIARDFGSFDAFQKHFTAASNAVEGNGWGILAYEPVGDQLLILQGENQQHLTVRGVTPILMCDVWEHAYYLQYKNVRADYTKAFWNVVNWSDVANRLAQARKAR